MGLSDTIRQWLLAPIIQVLGDQASAILNLNTKADKIMVTLADIQTALAADETAEGKIINLLTTQAQSISDLAAQLAAAQGDPAAIQAVVDQMNADAATMNTAAVNAATPPATQTPAPTPAPTPDPNA